MDARTILCVSDSDCKYVCLFQPPSSSSRVEFTALPPSRKAYELTFKYIPVRVTSFPSLVLVHLLIHALIHFCTHAIIHIQHDFICSISAILFQISSPCDFMNILAVTFSYCVIISYLIRSSLVVILFCFMLFIYSFISFQVRCFISLLAVLFFQCTLAFVS